MRKSILYLSILTFPFLGMITVNELVRLNTAKQGNDRQGIVTINSTKKLKEKCSWICHDRTAYCKENHVKFVKSYFDNIDPIYFGIINRLKLTGNYRLGNILFLVIFMPLIMYIFLTKSIIIQWEIREIKKR